MFIGFHSKMYISKHHIRLTICAAQMPTTSEIFKILKQRKTSTTKSLYDLIGYNFYPYLTRENNHMFGILVAGPKGHHLINTIGTPQRHM